MFFTLEACMHLSISETVSLCCTSYKWNILLLQMFPLILILPSIFQCLLRKKAHYKTLRTLPSLPPRLSSSDIPRVIPALTYKQFVASAILHSSLHSSLSFLPYSEHPSSFDNCIPIINSELLFLVTI